MTLRTRRLFQAFKMCVLVFSVSALYGVLHLLRILICCRVQRNSIQVLFAILAFSLQWELNPSHHVLNIKPELFLYVNVFSKSNRCLMFMIMVKHLSRGSLTNFCFHSFRQSGSRLYLRHHSSRGGSRHHSGVQPGQPESVWLRPGEAGLLQPGGRLEVGRMLRRYQVWNRVLSALRGRPRDQKNPKAPHELT